MPDYRSQADILAAQKSKDQSEQTSALFRALLQQQNERGMQETQGQQKLAQMAEAEAQGVRETGRNRGLVEELVKQHPRAQISAAGNGGVSINPHEPDPMKNAAADVKKQNLNRLLVKDVASDYDKRTQGLKSYMQSAQSIINALDSNDIQTVGQVKANLPRLEGERNKVTDAERQMILMDTAQGSLQRMKNWFAGDSAAISDTQKKALRNIVAQKLANAQKDMEASKQEVQSRWGHRIAGFDPEEKQDLDASLGSSAGAVMKNIDPQNSPAAIGKVDPAKARYEELLKKSKGQ